MDEVDEPEESTEMAVAFGRYLLKDIRAAWAQMNETEQMEFYNWLAHVAEELCQAWNNGRREPDWRGVPPTQMRR